jgi:hypothetical protein
MKVRDCSSHCFILADSCVERESLPSLQAGSTNSLDLATFRLIQVYSSNCTLALNWGETTEQLSCSFVQSLLWMDNLSVRSKSWDYVICLLRIAKSEKEEITSHLTALWAREELSIFTVSNTHKVKEF